MMQFSHSVQRVHGLKFIADALQLQSAIGRKRMLKQEFMTCEEEIRYQLQKTDACRKLMIAKPDEVEKLQHFLSEVHDINGSLIALPAGVVLDDVGLFEIKRFALLSEKIRALLGQLQVEIIQQDDVNEVIRILDPEDQQIPNFYVYDRYDEELLHLRKQYNELVHSDEISANGIRQDIVELEDKIRAMLASQLKQYAHHLLHNLNAIAELDLWLAKAQLAINYNLCKPRIGHQATVYRKLFNPAIDEVLSIHGKHFQPVDISLHAAPTLITGVNMGGKTVLLKTVALSQYLFQFGFFVPAESAVIVPVDQIITCIEDEQSELHGLSSYAAEMIKFNSIIHAAKHRENILALIDEPAKTTNPQEGEAIANGLIDMLQQYHVRSIITTHYNRLQTSCTKLRVKGLKHEVFDSKPDFNNIHEFMDYSLREIYPDDSNEYDASNDAFRIAKMLKIDKELMQHAAMHLKRRFTHHEMHH